ncbi:protein FAR1-RELATED SEQUENCE 5-like [Spinacia oleracea]|uniref:Protein FAR1-RELATED SEQUENCE 5-like n=1 Tax=Spinacia oleracea TaxID=3562 RepID=A0ABM3R876_SPIOL|nr:protein FAR1-RELATED SEQUENCE 5-like [Spinacia oleracea]
MGGGIPQTIMTDQAPAIPAAIRDVFPGASHRLCTWPLGENSKKNIATQRAMKGFTELFSYLLKYYDTVAEFEHYWPRFIKNYKCEKNVWLNNLYVIREHWCRAYSKDSFSGGALSSQRSESTNNSIKDRLRETDGLCDFYHLFLDVISAWRSKENHHDYRVLRGNRHMAAANVSILVHARKVYTGYLYVMFEEHFLRGILLNQERTFEDAEKVVYLLWKPATVDLNRHEVTFNKITFQSNCTCKHFSEVGLLCSHILRIYSIHCVAMLPEQYILKRWTKAGMCNAVVDEQSSKANVVPASVWKFQTMRNFVRLVTSSQYFLEARVEIDTAFDLLRQKVESVRGAIDFSEPVEGIDVPGHDGKDGPSIKDPKKRRKKGETNERPKGIVEKECNKKKAWRKRAEKHAENAKAKAQASVQEFDALGNPLLYSHLSSGSELRVLGSSLEKGISEKCVVPDSVQEDICGKKEIPDVVDSLKCLVQGGLGSQSKKMKGIYSTCSPIFANTELNSPAARVSLYDEIMANFDK